MSRARRIQRFLSQNTYMAKQFTGIEGSTVPLADTIEAFNKIADGEYDHVAEQAFFMCGGLDDVEQKWAEIQKRPLMAESTRQGPPGRAGRRRPDWCGRARRRWSSPAPPRATSASCRNHAPLLSLDASRASSTCRPPRARPGSPPSTPASCRWPHNRVSILAERAEMAHEIDLEQARAELERCKQAGENDDEAQEKLRRAEARVRAAERAS